MQTELDFAGKTFDAKRDGARLFNQLRDVLDLMRDGEWRGLGEISSRTGHPQASVSARLRDLRRPERGGYTVERRYVSGGLWAYRVLRRAD